MRWSQRRLIAVTFLALFIILSLLSWKRHEIPNYLPKEAHKFFHSDEYSAQEPSVEKFAHVIQKSKEILERPLLSYDESIELSSQSCPTDGVNFDTGAVDGNRQSWRDLPSSRISEWRHGIAHYLQAKVNSSGTLKAKHQGRGIVMAAGDKDAAIRARTSIRFLRSYNCTLPVEIFHFQNELSDEERLLITKDTDLGDLKVTFRVVGGIQKGDNWKAFEIKAVSIEQSSFEEVLYLDTDSYLLRDPEYLFEEKHFKETGLLLWPDYTKSHPTNPIWRLLGQQCRDEYEGESGQIVMARSRHQDVMWLAEYFARHRDDFYGFMGGDRDSFRAAALLLGKNWAGPGRLIASAGSSLKHNSAGGGHTMMQADPDGRWTFVHANLIKHGQFPRPLWQKIHRATNDRYEGGTYGSIDSPNDKMGEGVKPRVQQAPRLEVFMEHFEGYNETLVTFEDWDSYEELRGFEEKWFRLGGVH